jgi:DNA-binding CsgD family transcriptional regulator
MQLVNFHPGLLFVKDQNSKYIAGNDRTANLVGWKSVEDMVGKTDFDLPCEAASSADFFIKEDNIVLNTQEKLFTLDLQKYSDDKWHLLLCERTIARGKYTADASLEVVIHAIDVTGLSFFHAYIDCHNFDKKITGRKNSGSYIISDDYTDLAISTRQSEILYYLLRGKTAKEIGVLLNISDRTVEGHIDIIKRNLNCKNKSQLIEKAVALGYMFYIPKRIFNQQLID